MPYVRSSGESWEFVGEASLDKLKASSASNDDSRSVDDDPPLIRVNRDTITIEKMDELVSNYEVPSGYVCKIPTISEYVSTLSLPKIGVYKKSLWVDF